MSALARILPRIPASHRSYSSFGGGRFFNSSKPPKSPVAAAKSKSDRSNGSPKDSPTKASAEKTAQATNTPPGSAKPTTTTNTATPATDTASSSAKSFRNDGTSSSSNFSPSTTTAYFQEYTPYQNYWSLRPTADWKDIKTHQLFSLHRPLLLISHSLPIIFESPPAGTPLFRSLAPLNGEVKNEDKLSPPPFTSLNLDGTYGSGRVMGIDRDAEAARQLHRAMTITRAGATVDWEKTLKVLGIDVSQEPERINFQAQRDREWRQALMIRKWKEILMDSTKRKRRKKMKKHKLKKRRRLTRAQRLRLR